MPPFTPLSEDLRAFHAKRRDDVYPLVPDYAELRERLLGIGGLEVVFPRVHIDGETAVRRQRHDVGVVLSRGRQLSRESARLEEMDQSRCHFNVAMLYAAGRGRIGTGWGLSGDGLWREHSWMFSFAHGSSLEIVETTELRLVYYGVELSDVEAAWFADSELGRDRSAVHRTD